MCLRKHAFVRVRRHARVIAYGCAGGTIRVFVELRKQMRLFAFMPALALTQSPAFVRVSGHA